MVILPAIFYVLLAITAVVSGLVDFGQRRIPNWITLPGLILGLVLNTLRAQGAGLVFGLFGLLAALAVYIPLYLLRGMGAGDVKLMGAIGAIVGPANWIVVFLATAVIGGAAALALVLLKGRLLETWLNVSTLVTDLIQLRAPYKDNASLDVRAPSSLRMPHGVSIAGGALMLVVCSYLRVF